MKAASMFVISVIKSWPLQGVGRGDTSIMARAIHASAPMPADRRAREREDCAPLPLTFNRPPKSAPMMTARARALRRTRLTLVHDGEYHVLDSPLAFGLRTA
jgi:hypothetical protein